MSDLLNMSDKDFLNQGESLMGGDDVDIPQEDNLDTLPEGTSEEATDIVDSGLEDESEEPSEDPVETEEEPLDQLPSEEETLEEEASEEVSEPSDLEKVLQPFRANGKDVQVKNADEAITLMQLGANYTKKMQELSPNLKVLKTLEKHELLDETKLNYLIDLSKNDPKAIAKLIKDSNYEPEGFDNEEDNVEYPPTNHQVSEQAVQLEQVLESLESTPTYDKCIDLVGNQWDAKSKQLLTQEPELIRNLNEQMQAGIFDKVNAEVERVKMFGGLSGVSDFEAYKTVGAQMMQAGTLTPPQAKPVARTEIKPLDNALSKKRKAATSSRSSSKTIAKPKNSYLAMDDAEFLKINNIQI